MWTYRKVGNLIETKLFFTFQIYFPKDRNVPATQVMYGPEQRGSQTGWSGTTRLISFKKIAVETSVWPKRIFWSIRSAITNIKACLINTHLQIGGQPKEEPFLCKMRNCSPNWLLLRITAGQGQSALISRCNHGLYIEVFLINFLKFRFHFSLKKWSGKNYNFYWMLLHV